MASNKTRLDQLVFDRGLATSRSQAQALILAGRVFSGDRRMDKPGHSVDSGIELSLTPGRRYVGRGAFKLLGALDAFAIDPSGVQAIDVGSSTGGFTEILLERGASEVIAVDSGRGQLDWTLRSRPEIHVMEGCNARYLTPDRLPYRPGLATMDVSFISILKILPALVGCLYHEGEIVSLVKPQFEAGRGCVGRGGIVRDAEVHRTVLRRTLQASLDQGWGPQGFCRSSIEGADGNREFFVHLRPHKEPASQEFLEASIVRLTEETS